MGVYGIGGVGVGGGLWTVCVCLSGCGLRSLSCFCTERQACRSAECLPIHSPPTPPLPILPCPLRTSGLLHDTVEDCGDLVGLDEIEFAFGPAVRRIVEGETKFSKLPTHHPEDRNSSGVAAAAASRAAVVGSNNGTAPAAGSFSSADSEGSTGGDSSISSSGEGCGCEEFPASTSTSPPAAAPAVDPKAQDPKAQDLQFLFLAMTEEVR